MSEKLTQERLKELLNYDPVTGVFTWRVTTGNGVQAGDVVGCIRPKGYVQVSVDGVLYYAHRLAWFFTYGYLPENEVDHRDQIPGHNWILNLREIGHVCNLRNTGNYSNNKSGVKGIHWFKRIKKWRVQVRVNGKLYSFGYHEDFDEAVCHRLAVEQCLNWNGCDSNSPAYQYVQENIQPNAAR